MEAAKILEKQPWDSPAYGVWNVATVTAGTGGPPRPGSQRTAVAGSCASYNRVHLGKGPEPASEAVVVPR
jgi:hypothetical protein